MKSSNANGWNAEFKNLNSQISTNQMVSSACLTNNPLTSKQPLGGGTCDRKHRDEKHTISIVKYLNPKVWRQVQQERMVRMKLINS